MNNLNWEEKQSQMDYDKFIKDYISDALDESLGQTITGSSLVNALTEYDRKNEDYFMNTFYSKQFIGHNFFEAGETFDYYRDMGSDINPFDSPDLFVVMMIEKGVSDSLNNLDIINKNWDNEIVLDEKVINEIKEKLGIKLPIQERKMSLHEQIKAVQEKNNMKLDDSREKDICIQNQSIRKNI